MAEEIFALSPIAARPVQPSEADYDAIKEAFMETSRGRWFLGEYAKRNRNADTRMVLDAVARIEETIAAQKKPVRDPLLDEALASLRAALAEARDATTAAVNDLAIEQNLAPVRKGARVIREIAWRLREIGADGRICDLIDQQVAAIEGAAAKLAPCDLAAALSGAFDRIEGKIANLDADEAAASASPAPKAMPPEAMDAAPVAEASQPEHQVEAKIEGTAEASAMMDTSSAAPRTEATSPGIGARAETSATETVTVEPAVAEEPAIATSLETTATSEPTDAFDANDEAVLDMVAMEMAAFDTDEAYEPKLEDAEIYERQFQENQIGANHISANQLPAKQVSTSRVEAPKTQPDKTQSDAAQPDKRPASAASWEIDVTFASDAAAEPEFATALPSATPIPAAPEPEPESMLAPAPSLGSSLLANGIVPQPRAPRPDPLAPIRRMTQNERIAFFS